ncbi:LysM peptidoglycan-binding domain-containing protein [Enterococcus raffinosus]|uniref:LysM peptidoglycan-binding domain-containing protein n=1 Tax=Enterococcus raffinosus TaxID=71452 RepID=UPI002890BC00|nr:LysM peptidoglycan-binding domain-containing protein [Enterococcus raffinosus]MDT2553100.1 LysM peptidoglycan-binding domain-containing protein [Enterococcus raffinosus]
MKKLVLCILVLSFSLGACSSPNEKSATDTTEKTSISTKPNTKKITAKSEAKKYDSYQSILDDYTKKLQEASPKLVDEYNNEYPALNGDINALAELSNKKVEKLAEISNEGTTKMAKLQLAGESDYSVYEEWAGKLIDVYTQDAQKIMDAYLASAGSNVSVPDVQVPNVHGQATESSVEQSVPESSAPQVQQSEPSSEADPEANAQYGTVQPGDGPQQIAGRYGLSVDEFLALNGMDRSNFYFDTGQQVRVK